MEICCTEKSLGRNLSSKLIKMVAIKPKYKKGFLFIFNDKLIFD
jgi:hypothetical protein